MRLKQGKHVISRNHREPREAIFCSNQSLLQVQKKGNGFLRNKKDQGNLSHFFLLVTSLYESK